MTEWGDKMPEKLSLDDAIHRIPVGQRILIGSGAAVPSALVRGLATHASRFHDNEVTHLMLLGNLDLVDEKFANHFRDNSLFIGDNARKAVQHGLADYTPIFLSEIPRLIQSGNFPLGVALIQVTPPDKLGMCSLGLSVDIVRAGIGAARLVIAQINPQMPRTFGQALISYDQLDIVVEHSESLPELPSSEIDETVRAIARNAASLISDGSVLQLGIGSIPDAILAECAELNDLGIHTEMLSDGVMTLMQKGVVTNQTKKILQGRTLTSFAMGSRALYDYLHENPLVEFYPSDFVNDPFIIAKNDKMISVNSALQVDLTGQICADSLGPKFYSGIGGQVDFIRGASRSRHGKPIIALPSTAKGGKISRISGHLLEGAGVVTTRGDIHYVVTEFGVARLHGKTIRQRALELIRIAHPRFREELLSFVKENRYVYFDQALVDPKNHYPREFEENVSFGGKEFKVRPIRVTDEQKLQDFFYSHKLEPSVYHYLKIPQCLDHSHAQTLIDVDYHRKMTLIILQSGEFDDHIVAMGRIEPAPREGLHDFQVVIGENYRQQGMGSYLCSRLTAFARSRKLSCLRAISGTKNTGMKLILDKMIHCIEGAKCQMSSDLITYIFPLGQGQKPEEEPPSTHSGVDSEGEPIRLLG
jgi:acyl-CoA hydrolase